MIRLKVWQWFILAFPIALVVGFLAIAAGWQIHQWGINWIWGIFILLVVGWRWLLVKWTKPMVTQVEAVIEEVRQDLEATAAKSEEKTATTRQAEEALQRILEASREDLPLWEDWQQFWQRCQQVVVAIAHLYHPEVKYPLLNIYIPQAYGLIRGTVDDMDTWMQRLSPLLNQVTVGQAYQSYEVYRKLEPSARKLWKAWNWAQWLLNPAAAVAKTTTQRTSDRATQELLINLSQLLREAALRNLCQQAIALYRGGDAPTLDATALPAVPKAKTQTLRSILEQAESVETVDQQPVNLLLVGRTGAGKSSLINTLFETEQATVDVLPSTDQIQSYQWQAENGETLVLWDTPGYEQVNQEDYRTQVQEAAVQADVLLLVTPALDPALQMDADFLKQVQADQAQLPAIAVVTQVDRVRPLREWQPPYDWQQGDRPKEKSIREATLYRSEQLGGFCRQVLPIVTADPQAERTAWNVSALSMAMVEAIAPAKQHRLARFLRDRDARIETAARIIDRYTVQMATTQGLTNLLKSPVLRFLSTLTTGSPTLAYLLAEQIPVEQLPLVIGKLQLAYDLFSLLNAGDTNKRNFALLDLWSVMTEQRATPEREAWALGHALVEYWTQDLSIAQLRERFSNYLQQQPSA